VDRTGPGRGGRARRLAAAAAALGCAVPLAGCGLFGSGITIATPSVMTVSSGAFLQDTMPTAHLVYGGPDWDAVDKSTNHAGGKPKHDTVGADAGLRFGLLFGNADHRKPNASAHLLPEAGARNERTLEAVRCSAWFGAVSSDDTGVAQVRRLWSHAAHAAASGLIFTVLPVDADAIIAMVTCTTCSPSRPDAMGSSSYWMAWLNASTCRV